MSADLATIAKRDTNWVEGRLKAVVVSVVDGKILRRLLDWRIGLLAMR